MKFKIKTNNNREINLNMDAINAYTSRWKPGTPIEVEIRRRNVPKDPIRRFYFAAVLNPFGMELGYDRDEIEQFHNQLKCKYFQLKPDKYGVYKNVPHVFANESKLSISERHSFVEWVCRVAAKMGVYIDTGELSEQ